MASDNVLLSSLVKGQVKIHDDYQLEFQFDYWNLEERGLEHYPLEIDIFLFLPHNLGLNEFSFNRDQLMRQVSHYLRGHARAATLDDLDLKNSYNYFYGELNKDEKSQLKEKVVKEIKLFACNITDLLKNCSHAHDAKKIEKDLESVMSMIRYFRQNYVKFFKDEETNFDLDYDVKNALALVDEYILEILNVHCLAILKKNVMGQDIEHKARLNLKVEEILQEGVKEQKAQGHFILKDVQETSDRETYFYRRGVLRKYVYDVLYFNLERKTLETIYRNVIAGIAAALAAIWATWADVKRLEAMVENRQSYGFIPIIFLGILVYVMKDRIKDLGKEYFHEKLKNRIPDFRIYAHYIMKKMGKTIRYNFLQIDETIRYIPIDALRHEIITTRNIGRRFNYEPERKEEIINYYRKLFPLPVKLPGIKKRSLGSLKEILRINFGPYLGRLDNTEKDLDYFDEEGGAHHVVVPKVYHLNVVIKYSAFKSVGEKVHFFQKWRVILNKKGILRVEKIL